LTQDRIDLKFQSSKNSKTVPRRKTCCDPAQSESTHPQVSTEPLLTGPRRWMQDAPEKGPDFSTLFSTLFGSGPHQDLTAGGYPAGLRRPGR
ncbi:hypothetical protein, partial [Rhodovulum sulfidophilum]|uniref:hypothetical protein n=1 Tax=Rhodovulum sulfidophilum TaxID=35806 RepID=UPI001F3EBA70